MKETRIYMVDFNELDDTIGLPEVEQWSDEKLIEEAEKQGLVYSLTNFQNEWNQDNVIYPELTYMRILDVEIKKEIVGYQVYEKDEFPENMPDWWIFNTEEDAGLFAKWDELEDYTIVPIHDGDIEEPEFITFDDYIYSQSVLNFNETSSYETILLWLRDFGIPKKRGCVIADRILKYYGK